MSADAVQSFLDHEGRLVPARWTAPCLKSYRQATDDAAGRRPLPRDVRGVRPTRPRRRSSPRSAQACGINPRVLLVMLQKEQGLVTATAGSLHRDATEGDGLRLPRHRGLRRARTTASSTRSTRPRRSSGSYALEPDSTTATAPGVVNNVRFHPNAACGTLAGLHPEPGDREPVQLHAVPAERRRARRRLRHRRRLLVLRQPQLLDLLHRLVRLDDLARPDRLPRQRQRRRRVGRCARRAGRSTRTPRTPIAVHVYVDGQSPPACSPTRRGRTSVPPTRAGATTTGSRSTSRSAEGTHTLCAYAINQPAGYNPSLGCRTVSVVNTAPVGHARRRHDHRVDASRCRAGRSTATPPTRSRVHVYANGHFIGVHHGGQVPARRRRCRPRRAGSNRGFSAEFAVAAGRYTVCVYPINIPASSNPALGCRTVDVGQRTPGRLRRPGRRHGDARSGRAAGRSTPTPGPRSRSTSTSTARSPPALVANQPRGDVVRRLPGAGSSSGFSSEVPATPGRHTGVPLRDQPPDRVPTRSSACRDVTVG